MQITLSPAVNYYEPSLIPDATGMAHGMQQHLTTGSHTEVLVSELCTVSRCGRTQRWRRGCRTKRTTGVADSACV
jgi:hypothetical protein